MLTGLQGDQGDQGVWAFAPFFIRDFSIGDRRSCLVLDSDGVVGLLEVMDLPQSTMHS